MVPMRWDVLAVGLVLAGLITLVFRWVKNKIPTKNKVLKAVRTLMDIAFVIWLLVVVICTARYLLDDWERAVAIHRMQPVVNYLEVGWRCIIKGPELIEAAKELPSRLPQVALLPPPPTTPTAVPAVTLEELRRRELPTIPLEIRSVAAAELVNLGVAQTTVNSKKTVVTVNGVVSPTLGLNRMDIETVSSERIISDGLPEILAPTTKVTLQIFKDGTLLVSSKTISETVNGWLRDIRLKSEQANDLDVAGRLPKQDWLRTELAQTMSQVRVVLEFNGVTTDPAAEYGPAFTETEKLVNRLQVLPVAAGKYKFDIHQAPRGNDEGGTPQLQAYVSALRRQYYELSSRHRILADQVALGKVKVDGRERKALLTDTQNLLWTVRDLKSKLNVEMGVNGTVYETTLLQWLNAMELDLVALTTRI